MKSIVARLVTWCLLSRMPSLEWLWPGEMTNSIPFSEHQARTRSDDQAWCSSTCKIFIGPKDRSQPFSIARMNSPESSVESNRADRSRVIISTGNARRESGGVIHSVSTWTRSLKVVVLGMDDTGTLLGLWCKWQVEQSWTLAASTSSGLAPRCSSIFASSLLVGWPRLRCSRVMVLLTSCCRVAPSL